jgi:hypothetical protein
MGYPGFWGYIGLLLNAPYKIDSMVWMRLGYISLSFFLFSVILFFGLVKPKVKWGILGRKMRASRVWEIFGV